MERQEILGLAARLWDEFRYRDAESILEAAMEKHSAFAEARDLYDRIRADRSTLFDFRQRGSSALRFYIDSPRNRPVAKDRIGRVEIRGWVETVRGGAELVVEQPGRLPRSLPIPIARPDVVAHLRKAGHPDPNPLCGFSFDADLSGTVRLSLRQSGADTFFVEIFGKKASQVLEGRDGWLFLDNDTNGSADLFTGKTPATVADARAWGGFARASAEALSALGVASCISIAPSKEDVFPELHPLESAPVSLLDVVSSGIVDGGGLVSCPVGKLRREPESYYRTDTHWSALGAWISVLDMLDVLGLPAPEKILPRFSYVEVMGDLGSKLIPSRTSIQKVWASQAGHSRTIFDNRVVGSGNIRIYANDEPEFDSSILFFGDSFSTLSARIMSDIFARVIRINTPLVMPIIDIVAASVPDIVILQTNARYLKTLPRVSQGIEGTPLARLSPRLMPTGWHP